MLGAQLPPIFQSQAMRELIARARRAAASELPILLCGETGTGKEVIAQLIHDASPRKGKAFIPVNCAAIPKELAEAELFGHTKGAFTGSTCERPGMFELAHNGTMFLDELADMDLGLQAKILRVLQSGEIRPVGSSNFRYANFRLVAALNTLPEKAMAANRLREDLYHRICTFELFIPPLRERREDITPIANALLKDTGKTFSESAASALQNAPWTGNVRQLINAVRRAIVMTDGPVIESPELGLAAVACRKSEGLLADKEMEAISLALARCGGNKLKAARMLGIGRQTLYNKLNARSDLK